jgi:hypothetical protein
VQGTSGKEQVQTPTGCWLQGFGSAGDIAVVSSSERTDGGIFDNFGDSLYAFKIAVAGSCKTSFNHIDLEALELTSNTELFVTRHGRARALLAIAQGGVKNDELIAWATDGHLKLLKNKIKRKRFRHKKTRWV